MTDPPSSASVLTGIAAAGIAAVAAMAGAVLKWHRDGQTLEQQRLDREEKAAEGRRQQEEQWRLERERLQATNVAVLKDAEVARLQADAAAQNVDNAAHAQALAGLTALCGVLEEQLKSRVAYWNRLEAEWDARIGKVEQAHADCERKLAAVLRHTGTPEP